MSFAESIFLTFSLFTSVIIMSSIMEHMCADVFQQTATTLRPPVEGQEPIPYRNLLPTKEPIHKALSTQFQVVLRKGWVDSRALHLFESLLNMGGVFWFTNNLVKVGFITWTTENVIGLIEEDIKSLIKKKDYKSRCATGIILQYLRRGVSVLVPSGQLF